MKTRKLTILFAILIAVITTIVISAFRQKAQNKPQTQTNQVQDKSSTKDIDDAATPIIDFFSVNLNADQSRINKNAQYDNSSFVISEPPPNAGEFIRFAGENSISDIPIEKSTVILEGQVNDSKAFLSNDKSGVYSEFTIVVSKVLKSNDDAVIKSNETITAERFGGRVRYPSGKIIRYKISEQGSPSVNSKYLFFLSKTQTNGYKILTAYELKDDKVFALDGARTFPRSGAKSIFNRHDGQDYGNFISEISEAIEKEEGN
jgi:hypothetical protein